MTSNSISRPAITKLLIGTALLLGLLGLFVALAQGASAGSDLKVTVNSTANTDDGDCEGAPNAGTGNCTLREAINMVNDGNADIINFHPPVFSKEQPGVINLCYNGGENELPMIERDVVIDSKNSGVILDGGDKDDDCGRGDPADWGLMAVARSNGLDFELNGGKNFEIRNIECTTNGFGILVSGSWFPDYSLGTVEITGVIIDNVCREGIRIRAANLESASITNSEISSNQSDAVQVDIDACNGNGCLLTDSVLNISGNRLNGGVNFEPGGAVAGGCCSANGVNIDYNGTLNIDEGDIVSGAAPIGGGTKITASVRQNEVINGTSEGVSIDFVGCGQDAGVNFHVDENDQINGGLYDGVDVSIWANACSKGTGGALAGIGVSPGSTSDGFDGVVTVNGNGDIESDGGDGPLGEAVSVTIQVCCEQSDSSGTVEVNDNGRITGEDNGVQIETSICCGDDNSSDVSVSGNDEITGEGDDGIDVDAFAGSNAFLVGPPPGAAGTGFDADDNTCTITVDGNNEIDGVGDSGVEAVCFAGAFGFVLVGGLPGEEEPAAAGPVGPLSSGDGNVTTINVTNNNDIDGDDDGVDVDGIAGSFGGEADDNLVVATVSGNGEVTGDDDDGVDVDVIAGTLVEEGDDNATVVTVGENAEVGGNGGNGLELKSFAGGVTDGSEGNSTAVTAVQNGDVEGSGGDGIHVRSEVCCDPDNTNTIDINNNKGEITGHDDDGIEINICCSVNTITIMDNEGNIRGGDGDGLNLGVCGAFFFEAGPSGIGTVANFLGDFIECLDHSLTHLTVTNNSFSDSEDDGISIAGGAFEDEGLGVKSVISNNVIEGNGGDGIDIQSASGLNIGPGNEIFENGTEAGDNGIEIDWCLGGDLWGKWSVKLLASHNTITQNSIYDNFGLGIDLVGYNPAMPSCSPGLDFESTVGCVPFTETAINPNDCIPFPDLETQSGDKLIGSACSECTVEVFWANGGQGEQYIISGEADADGAFSIELPCDLGDGDLTATATDKLKNTSEFSETLVTLGTGSCATDTPAPTDTPVPPDETDTPVPADPTATPEPTKLCGDPNVDGSVNSIDATVILQLKAAMIDSLANESSADVNNSGSITSVDASLILQVTAGLIGEAALVCP